MDCREGKRFFNRTGVVDEHGRRNAGRGTRGRGRRGGIGNVDDWIFRAGEEVPEGTVESDFGAVEQ
jgi:hypothetical protein